MLALLSTGVALSQTLDYGDAPDLPYFTLSAHNGACQSLNRTFCLGTTVDAEKDGQPNVTATGDGADEDGVVPLDPLVPGATAKIRVTLNPASQLPGWISAWVDWDADGKWDHPAERVIQSQINPGARDFTLTVPASAKPGFTYARFRLSQEGVVAPAGASTEAGEVEDYRIVIQAPVAYDFGDAPESPFPTKLASDGARHRHSQGVFLGNSVDTEPDGQPNANASGDDVNPTSSDDEDGVAFINPVTLGQNNRVHVTASVQGGLWAWIDFNLDGDWLDSGEQIFAGTLLNAGTNSLEFAIPSIAKAGTAVARFRFTRGTIASFTGEAADGEVEDHPVTLVNPTPVLDYGDAPDPTYPTLKTHSGASHRASLDFCLGSTVDAEFDGQPNVDATGDGIDEDGVVLIDPLRAGQTASGDCSLKSSNNLRGALDAWCDWDANGAWDDPAERVLDVMISPGSNDLTITVPATAKPGRVFARFRLSQQGAVYPSNPSPETGEVEDYLFQVESAPTLDLGDAPDSYRTKIASDGPRHTVNPRICLGKLIDAEPDGQPTSDALGDDVNPSASDDEDGVAFLGPIAAGGTAAFRVEASTAGRLSVWLDLDRSLSFAEPTDLILNNVPIAGPANFSVAIPATAKPGESYMRFRFSTAGVKTPHGIAQDGEVEDYRVVIEAAMVDFGDAPEFDQGGYPTTLARNGAYHRIDPRLILGKLEDGEPDGQPTADSLGDDLNPPRLDDEDGILFTAPLIPGSPASIEVAAPYGGILDGWIDYDRNYSWAEPDNYVFKSIVLPSGSKTLSFVPPTSAKSGRTYARFRLSRKGGLTYTGDGGHGEVEDHLVEVSARTPCDLTCAGQEFWLTFPGNYAPDPANPVKPQLLILGLTGTGVTVSAPGIGYNFAGAIPAGGLLTVTLPKAVDLADANDVIGANGIHVVATARVGIHALSKVKYTSDGYLALPVEALGTRHMILAHPNVHADVPELEGSQFALVGTQPDTRVLIIPSVVTGVRDEGVAYVIKVNAGETYQLRTTSGAPADLTGTILISDKPIAVFAGHQCANVQSLDVFFCDYLVEQLPPLSRWGAEFYTRPLDTRSGGDTLRILAAYNNTLVQVNGVWTATLDRGDVYETILTGSAQILATRPVLVAQYAHSSDFDLVEKADPFMTLVPPRPMFRAQYAFCLPDGFATHHVNLIVPNGAVGSLQLDGAPLGGVLIPIGATGYSETTATIGAGAVHILTASQPFGLNVYGWAEYESYGWPGCFFLGDTRPPVGECPPDVEVTAEPPGSSRTACQAAVPDLRGQARFTDECGLSDNARVRQDPPPGTLVGVGSHPITLSIEDLAGNIGRCIVHLVVLDPVPDGDLTLECPDDMRVLCDSREGAVVEFAVMAWRGCTPIPLDCEPPSGSLFPRGVTTVLCHNGDPQKPVACSFRVIVACNRLDVRHVGQAAVLEWTSEGTLQSATDISGPWQIVPNATSPYPVNPANQRLFYRILEP